MGHLPRNGELLACAERRRRIRMELAGCQLHAFVTPIHSRRWVHFGGESNIQSQDRKAPALFRFAAAADGRRDGEGARRDDCCYQWE